MIPSHVKTKCKNCGKEIRNDEASDGSFIRRRKLTDEDPRVYDVWFEDWCKECSENWKPYSESQRKQGL